MSQYHNKLINGGTLSDEDFNMSYTSLSDISEQIQREEKFLKYLQQLAANKEQGKE